ncbi:MAG: isoleucine--tRNA ligase [Caldilineaceae bacterium]|nr:isoleucine--tRNA ligase [Caldilineaceae bacterium]
MSTSDVKPVFAPVSAGIDYAAMEEDILQRWRDLSLLERIQEERADGEDFTFFEGPPTANGPPGIHHVLARAFKDMFPRYRTMQGCRVLRKGGWDTHGLPVEIEVEKALGLGGKKAIEDFGIAEFNRLCRESVSEYIGDWEAMTERMAFMVDMNDPYVTFENEYVESLWWICKQLWDEDLLFQGFKSVPYCPRCGTPLSSHELSLGYKDDTEDPSVYVKFKLADEEGTYFLAWTTTPWTLPGNAALAVGPDLDYVQVRTASGERYWLAAERLAAVLSAGFEETARCKGADLVGRKYEPLYSFLPVSENHAYVAEADFVTTGDGTGIVHVAPAFGADDLALGQQLGLPVIQTVLSDGTFRAEVKPWAGQFVKDADPGIIKDLDARGLLLKAETYLHTYPFCWRCDSPLLYYAKETWYIRTSALRERLVELNQKVNWYPDHIKNGRFGHWLENNVDWALGRDRYWGTPLPIWRSDAPGSTHTVCIGSVAELSKLSGRDLTDLDLHRPFVDEITWPAPDGGTMRRVTEVADCWFDSGAMPVAQWHHPFANQAQWETHRQADFICEAIDQTRGWFYTLHAISSLLFDQPAYLNVICLGHILDAEGRKMSKSLGNVVNPWDVMNRYGADATRWTLYSSAPPGNSRRFSLDLVAETVNKFLNRLWNSYSFQVTYANLAGWVPEATPKPSKHPLDRWLLAELQSLVRRVTDSYETYDVLGCTRPVVRFVERMSNWYVRLNRRRFWDGDAAALQTLHTTLVTLSRLIAPAAPFVAEAIHQNLATKTGKDAPISVHLCRWPEVDESFENQNLTVAMSVVQEVARLGLAARQSAGIKVRTPLAQAVVQLASPDEREAIADFSQLLCDELNVKRIHLESTDNLQETVVFPLPRQLGQKYGAGYPRIRDAMAAMDQEELARAFTGGRSLALDIDSDTFEIAAEEVEVRKTPKAGFAVADRPGRLVAVATDLTPELKREGLARELVRHVQQRRKELDLAISDRIHLELRSDDPELARIIDEHGTWLRAETLCTDLRLADTKPAGEGKVPQVTLTNGTVAIHVRKAEQSKGV